MLEPSESLEQMQNWLQRLQAGDASARHELINHACRRLEQLARKMLRDFPGVGRWEDTGDVCQNATLRLWTSLTSVTPPSLADFFRLAALNIRRELIDLARSHYGPEGLGANHASKVGEGGQYASATSRDAGDITHEPGRLAAWTEFHQKVDSLPAEDREIFDLLWYQELSQADAARLLNVSERTVRRRWRFARVRIHESLRSVAPVSWEPAGAA